VKVVREVDFRAEPDLTLCVSDLKFVNFIKDLYDRIVAVDFGGYPFLPRSFFDFALQYDDSGFGHRISRILQCPRSEQVKAIMSPSYALAPFSTNDVGEQISLLSFLFFSFSYLASLFRLISMYFTGLPERLKPGKSPEEA
jgi:hypothetical protein